MEEDRLPENEMPVIRVPARPADVNPGGSIFGGWIMSYVDIAGSIPAWRASVGRSSPVLLIPSSLKNRCLSAT